MEGMTASFEMTPDAERFLRPPGGKAEYVVFGPVNIEVGLKSGEVVRPQEIRERITRCRDCENSEKRGSRRYCKAPLGMTGYFSVCDDDFCSCGYPRVVTD